MATLASIEKLLTKAEQQRRRHEPARYVEPVPWAESVSGMVLDDWQRRALCSPSPRQLWLCSRQSGKSQTAALLSLHTAIYWPSSLILLLSRALRQSQEGFRKVLDVYNRCGETAPSEAESALRLELANGSRIIALPGREETIRSYSGVTLLVIDEASRVPDALYYAVRPMLAVSGGRLVCLTTPWGKRGFFYTEWTEGGARWERVKITADQCPRIPRTFLEEERSTMPLRLYQQEYDCEFTDTEDSVFLHEHVMGALSSDIEPLFAPVLDTPQQNGMNRYLVRL